MVKSTLQNTEESTSVYFPTITAITKAYQRLKQVVKRTPLELNTNLSEQYNANIYLKREDLQVVRSYKIRGAYNKISSLTTDEMQQGVVCASAGNHAQGFAYSCAKLKIKGVVFMPTPTPRQKINKVKFFGKEFVEVVLVGDTFDDAYAESLKFCQERNMIYVPPFDNEQVIEGQGTVGMEILEDAETEIDFLFMPIGGGGLSAGVGSYFEQVSPQTQLIGAEPAGAPAMYESFKQNQIVTLEQIDKFVDGAAVRRVGNLTFEICRRVLKDIVLVPEGKVCSTILKLYNEEAIVVEPAGALSIAALDFYKDQIKGKNVVCIVSGSNNDITRMEEIKERSLLYEGLKHYFMITFPQRAGALKNFLNQVLGPTDDITLFEYTKKTNREEGPALVGIEVQQRQDYERLVQRMKEAGIRFKIINEDIELFSFLI
ncbi:MAG: threonine ammonia-lyase [Cytophagales bacterium]|nr:threonine ammonia-lyase [Cytophagales bacterium]MDW8383687.1 threonine ammonia-lyase [Flammeovirgaceae bacterium]